MKTAEKKKWSFNDRVWVAILLGSFLTFFSLIGFRPFFLKPYEPDFSMTTLSVDSPEEMTELLGDICLYPLLSKGEISDFSGSLGFDEGELENPERWNYFHYSYSIKGDASEGIVEECRLNIYFPNYSREIYFPELDGDNIEVFEVNGISVEYYLLEPIEHFSGEIGVRETIRFTYKENIYILETILKEGSGQSIWSYFSSLF